MVLPCTTGQVCAATGLSQRQLEYWDTTGLLHPSGKSGTGKGSRRYYTAGDVQRARVVAALLAGGVSLQQVRRDGGRLIDLLLQAGGTP